MADLSSMEVLFGVVMVLYVPISQFVGLKYALNGMRGDVKAIKQSIKTIESTINAHETSLQLYGQRIDTLEKAQ